MLCKSKKNYYLSLSLSLLKIDFISYSTQLAYANVHVQRLGVSP